jgi:flavin reductase (DIM6/NTAB) family NADH-FMN oxidoreductase RutF
LGTHDLFIARVEALHLDDDWKNNEYPSMITYTRGKYGVVEKI